jgi:hypothetical protein
MKHALTPGHLYILAALLSGLAAAPAFAVTHGLDFDGNGFGDVAIGEPDSFNGAGRFYMLFGVPTSVSPTGYVASVPFDENYLAGNEDEGPEQGDHLGAALAWGDFNGDHVGDLVIGSPGEDLAGATDVGAIHVLLGPIGSVQYFSPVTPGMTGTSPRAGERFGSALAVGDFNADGADDLAVGAPGAMFGGRVYILFGRKQVGIVLDFTHFIDITWTHSPNPSPGTGFGSALAAGDLNCDGRDDLAIGSPNQILGSASGAGEVIVAYSGTNFWPRVDRWSQNNLLVPNDPLSDPPDAGDAFGSALAIGNFNFVKIGDHFCNALAVGVPGENNGSGAVNVLYSAPTTGLMSANSQFFSQDRPATIAGAAEQGDEFGSSLAVSNVDSDVYDDLIVGVPGENDGAGVVNLIEGSSAGLTATGNKLLIQGSGNVPGGSEGFHCNDNLTHCWFGDAFGMSVGAVPFRDLVIGAPYDTIDGVDSAGWAIVLHMNPNTFGSVSSKGIGWDSRNFKSELNAASGTPLTSFGLFGRVVTQPRIVPVVP